MKKKARIIWITIMCCAIAFVCCLGGCGSEPDVAEPSLETAASIEASQESGICADSVDEFYDLESFLENADNTERESVADLASLEYFYLPTGIPEGYRLYKITAAKNAFFCFLLLFSIVTSQTTVLT